jgi:hypothetical protein
MKRAWKRREKKKNWKFILKYKFFIDHKNNNRVVHISYRRDGCEGRIQVCGSQI